MTTSPTPDTGRTIYAPWTDEQVTALNAFQHHGRMHPFTCGAVHSSGRSPLLVATPAEWICPDPSCDYTQDWAHAFMAAPDEIVARPNKATAPCSAVGFRVRHNPHSWEPQPEMDLVRCPGYDPAAASAVVAVAAPPTGQTTLRDRIAAALLARIKWATVSETQPYDGLTSLLAANEFDLADAVLAVLPPPADRAAVLREEAALIRAHCPDHLDSDSAEGAWMACHCDVADDMLRRLVDETQPSEAPAHSCGNCEGIDPGSCLANPDRPKPPPMDPWRILGIDNCLTPATHNQGCACTAAAEPEPVRHAPGTAILCPDCSARGHAVCMADVPVHAVPLPGSNGISACCGRPPCEFVGERVTRDPGAVTCPGPAASAGVQTDEETNR